MEKFANRYITYEALSASLYSPFKKLPSSAQRANSEWKEKRERKHFRPIKPFISPPTKYFRSLAFGSHSSWLEDFMWANYLTPAKPGSKQTSEGKKDALAAVSLRLIPRGGQSQV